MNKIETIPFLNLLQQEHEAAKAALDVLKNIVDQKKDWPQFQETARTLLWDLKRHFVCEERGLFPVLSQYRPMILMEVEHEELLDLQNNFEKLLQENSFNEGVSTALEKLSERLRAHILEEDRGIFPLADERLSSQEKQFVETEMNRLSDVMNKNHAWAFEQLERPVPKMTLSQTNLFEAPKQPVALPTLYETEHHTLQHVHLQAGQKLSKHWAAQHQCVIMLAGKARFISDDQDLEIMPGQIITLDPRYLYALEAIEDSSLLVFKVWPKPNYLRA